MTYKDHLLGSVSPIPYLAARVQREALEEAFLQRLRKKRDMSPRLARQLDRFWQMTIGSASDRALRAVVAS